MARTATAIMAAAALLLLVSGTATATTVYWTPAHELAPVGNLSYLAVCDLDGDGDCDVSMLSYDPAHQYWNVGSPQAPSWQLDVSEFGDLFFCDPSGRPGTFGDLDADGDKDLVFGCFDGDLHMYWNIGTAHAAVWHEDASMFQGFTVEYRPTPCLADLDADGDLDLVLARDAPWEYVHYIENTGTPTSPQWTDRGALAGVAFPTSAYIQVSVGDLDGDEDLDLVGSCDDSMIRCWENVGTPQSFQFVANPSMLVGVSPISRCPSGVALADFNGDGRLDLLVAGWYVGDFQNYLYLNNGLSLVQRTSWSAIKAMYSEKLAVPPSN